MLAEKVKQLHKQGFGRRKIADMLGSTESIVYGIIRRGHEVKSLKSESIKLREQGFSYEDIAEKLGIHYNTAYTHAKDVEVKPSAEGDKFAEKLYIQGYSVKDISIIMDIKEESADQYLRRVGATGSKAKRELCLGLRMDGYYIYEVAKITGISVGMVKHFTSGISGLPVRRARRLERKKSSKSIVVVDKKPKKIKMKKEVKKTVSAIEQRAVLGQGVEAGVYSLEVKLNPKRDEGRMVSVFYKEYGGTVNRVDIRVRDGVSDTEAGERWCKKFNREFLYTK